MNTHLARALRPALLACGLVLVAPAVAPPLAAACGGYRPEPSADERACTDAIRAHFGASASFEWLALTELRESDALARVTVLEGELRRELVVTLRRAPDGWRVVRTSPPTTA
ncbi:MAG: hypothetical protein M3Y87_25935 [Myxococcota bacterium]|nr:hypothetical protein [Myxococcota bacterium]